MAKAPTDPAASAAPPGAPGAPGAAAPPPSRRGWLGRLLRSLSAYLLGVAAVLGLLAGALGWLLYTEAGTGWLLARVPGLKLEGQTGSLLGGFGAQQVELPLPGEGARLQLHDLRWSPPRLRAGSGSVWLRVGIDELQARRIDLHLAEGPSTASEPPASLALPVGLDVAALQVDALHIDGLDTPLRGLHARVGLGVDGGARHRVDALRGQWDRLHFSGQAQVGTGGRLPLAAALQLTQAPGSAGDWGAALQLQGPLAEPSLQAQLRGRSSPERPAQTLDASAVLHPFADWPLGELQAQARALDLSALHADAPRTALDLDASARTDGFDQPAAMELALDNHDAGRWNEGRLPLRRLRLAAQARPDDPTRLELSAFDAELGSARAAAGRISGSGQWTPADWHFDTRLSALQPSLLDARAPRMRLDGRVQLTGSGFDSPDRDQAAVAVRGQLDGRLLDRATAPPVQLRLDARAQALRIELRELLAQSGGARASLDGTLTRASRSAGWAARGRASLRDFDPLPWWPGPEDSAWRRGPHRLNAKGDFDLALPAGGTGAALPQLARLRGRAEIGVEPSLLAGVPLSGRLAWQGAPDGSAQGQLQLLADDNRLQAEAQLDQRNAGAADRWTVKADLPALKRLQPIWALLPGHDGPAKLAGKLNADARFDGRWPALSTQGRLQADALQLDTLKIEHVESRWTLGSRSDSPLDAQLLAQRLRVGERSAEQIEIQLKGTPGAHRLAFSAESKALPPAWVEAIQAAPAGTAAKRTLARLELQGGAVAAAGGWRGWRGALKAAELRGDAKAAPPWAQLEPFDFELLWADGPLRLKADAGRATLLGAALKWSRIAWSAADGASPARLDADARLEPLDVAPLLARAQPAFGWGGDLRIGGHLVLQSAPAFSADIVFERASGDLSVTDDAGTRTLGLSDLRIGLNAHDGLWSFTAGLAGKTLGAAAAALVVHSTPQAIWPGRDAPAEGVLELQVADLGTWGPWLPPGWRLSGAMHTSAALGGRFGAPAITGELTGSGIGVRNVLQGVEVRDGEVRVTLLGDSARIEKFAASAGKGRLTLRGDASLGAAPHAELALNLDQFQLLGRVDRRIIASGDATLKLGRDTLALNGDFRVDEGLIDFSRSEAPRLSDDVVVHRGGGELPDMLQTAEAEAERSRRAALDLQVHLGEKLRIRGRGLDAGLRGDLRLTAPQGRLRVDGSVRTADGTYRAYRQRLDIVRGLLVFNGPIENPQLDIEAIRPNLDVRVGVAVTGTVLVPRVRLFSEPEMSDAEKLSWLLRGRASEGPGSGDAALLQAAATALLAGEDTTPLDQLFDLFGLDEFSIRPGDGSSGTIVSVGKQLSRNWYVGYARGLNATTGNWQLIYRVAQRFTVRAQSGEHTSIDLIWTWRWN